MAGESDFQEFLNERFRRVDEKLDKVIDVLTEIRTAMLQIVASQRLARENLEAPQVANARLKGYEGERCWHCRNFTLVRNGPCLRCDTCGAASGCD